MTPAVWKYTEFSQVNHVSILNMGKMLLAIMHGELNYNLKKCENGLQKVKYTVRFTGSYV